MLRSWVSTVLLSCSLIGTSSAEARWLPAAEADAHFEDFSTSIVVRKDFSLETTQEMTEVIDKPSAIDDVSVFRLVYSPATAQIRILSASVTANGHTVNVDGQHIEEHSLAQQGQAYDSVHEIKVSFPSVAVGSKLRLKFWRKDTAQPFPGMVSTVIPLSRPYPITSQHIKVESEVPLQYKLLDPLQALKFTDQRPKRGVKFQIDGTKVVFRKLVEEPQAVFTEPQEPVLYLASSSNWVDFGTKLAAEYERVLSTSLPDALKAVVDSQKAKTDKADQLEGALAELHRFVRYYPGIYTSGGQHGPKDLKEILSAHYADGKDYVTLATAVFRGLGFEATPSWAMVDPEPQRVVQFQPPIAGQFFNYGVVKVKVGDKYQWIDPTSPTIYARGTAGDLAGAYALVLKTGDSKIETVPFATAEENSVEVTRYLSLNSDGTFDDLTRSKFKGYVASQLSDQAGQTIDNLLYADQTPEIQKGEFRVDRARMGIDFGSVATVKFSLPPELDLFSRDQSVCAGSVLFPVPVKQATTTIIQGGTPTGDLPTECKVDTPFLAASRTFTRDNEFTKVVESIEVKSSVVPVAQLHGPQAQQIKQAFEQCWTEASLLFKGDGLVDQKFRFKHTRPWKLSLLQLEAEKVKKGIPNIWRSITAKKQNGKALRYVSIVPGWSAGNSKEQIQAKIHELLDNPGTGSLRPLVAKLLVLELIQNNPQDPELYALLGIAEGTKTPTATERAKVDVYTALEIDPKSPPANRALTWYLANSGASLADVIDEAKYALSLDPASESSRVTLASAYLKAKNFKKALDSLGAVEDFKTLEDIYTAMADYDKLDETYEAETKKRPVYSVYVNYAVFLAQHGDTDKAVEICQKALAIQNSVEVHKILADVYVRKASHAMEKTGKGEDALEWLNKALAEDNTNILAHEVVGGIFIERARETKDEGMSVLGEEHLRIANQLQKNTDRTPAGSK